MSEPDARPWDRLPDEPAKWYERFDAYRLLGPARSLEWAWEAEAKRSKTKQGKRPSSTYYEMARRYRWKERAEAWDEHERPLRRLRREAEAEAMRRRQARAGRRLQRVGCRRLESLPPEEIKAADATAMVARGVEIERKAVEQSQLQDLVEQFAEWKRAHAGDSPKPPS